jgi:hypothetical protein
VDFTLGDLAALPAGSYHETFHFVLNNYVPSDNRIPPYGMSYDEAQKRNALPVPADQYGNPGAGGVYNYWDEIDLNALKPTGAASAEIALLYQGTSWEYIQFLNEANNEQNTFLGLEGRNMLEAWVNAEVPVAMTVGGDKKMVPPVVMASATWGAPPTGNNTPTCTIDTPTGDVVITEGDSINYAGTATDSDGTIASYVWAFNGGSPASSNVEDPGNVSYTTAGTYTTSFSATDDGGASCTPATVQVTVNAVGVNNPPVAADDNYSTDQDTALNVPAPGVLDNDTDDDKDLLSVANPLTNAQTTQGGSITLNADGSFSYEPSTGFTGDDSFTYHATDGTDVSNQATVTIHVAALPMACNTYPDKGSCNAQASCRWDNRNKVCIAK